MSTAVHLKSSSIRRYCTVLAVALGCLAATTLLALPGAEARELKPGDFKTILFRPLDPPKAGDTIIDFKAVLTESKKVSADVRAKLPEAFIALDNYQKQPSKESARKALFYYDLISRSEDFRSNLLLTDKNLPPDKKEAARKQIEAARKLFFTLELLKFDAVHAANLEINRKRRARGETEMRYSVRVGSSGQRFMDLFVWALQGRNLDEIPLPKEYILKKLFSTDDDVNNFALRADKNKDPSAEDRINGQEARTVLSALLGFDPKNVKVEFLAPHKAYHIIRTKQFDGREGRPYRYEGKFQKALKLSEQEAYNGFFAEEQLHRWGLENGIAIDMKAFAGAYDKGGNVLQALADAVVPYKDTEVAADNAKDAEIKGIDDADAWFANNFRMAFVQHTGNVQDQAKYLLRTLLWFHHHSPKKIDFNPKGVLKADYKGGVPKELMEVAKDLKLSHEDFNRAINLASAIRDPDNKTTVEAAAAKWLRNIPTKDRAAAARALLAKVHKQALLAGHRMQLHMLAERTKELLQKAASKREGQLRDASRAGTAPPEVELPSVHDLAESDPKFRRLLDSLAGAYANLPKAMVDELKQDLGRFIKDTEKASDRRIVYSAQVSTMLTYAMKIAGDGAEMTVIEARAFADIKELRKKFEEAVDTHFEDMRPLLDLDTLVNKMSDAEATRSRFVLYYEAGRLRSVGFEDVEIAPSDIALDIRRLRMAADFLKLSQAKVLRNLHAYIAGKIDKETFLGLDESWPKLALDTLREFEILYDPSKIKPLIVRRKTRDGREIAGEYRPTRGDAAVNLGITMFKAGLKGGTAAWKIWGDIQDAGELLGAMQKIVSPPSRQTKEQAAQLHALALSKTIGLMEYAEKFSKWGKQPYLVDKFGSSLQAAALLSANPFRDDAAQMLIEALLKDIVLLAHPEMATAFFLYDVASWSYSTLTTIRATKRLVTLLLEKGEWDTDRPDGIPRLKHVDLYRSATYYNRFNYEPEARQRHCREAIIGRSGLGFWENDLFGVGLAALAKPLDTHFSQGIWDGDPRKPSNLNPREDLLTLYFAEGFDSRDPVLPSVIKSVTNLEPQVRRDNRTWTTAWLEDLGIFALTKEYNTRMRPGPIRAETVKPRKFEEFLGVPQKRRFLGALKEEGRAMFGFYVTEYMARRQHIIECQLIDKIVEEATKKKQAQELEKLKLDDIRKTLDQLIYRMVELDRKVWPNIARSADPFPGPDYDKPDPAKGLNQKYIPITHAYVERSRDNLEFLEKAYRYHKATAKDETKTKDKAKTKDKTKAKDEDKTKAKDKTQYSDPIRELLKPGIHAPDPSRPSPSDLTSKESRRAFILRRLKQQVDLVQAFEDSYNAILSALAGRDGWVVARSGIHAWGPNLPFAKPFSIAPHHVRLEPGADAKKREPKGHPLAPAVMAVPVSGQNSGVVERWERSYDAARQKALDDLTKVVAGFRERLRPISGATLADVKSLAKELYDRHWRVGSPEELALKHPLWPRLRRLRLQIHKLKLMLPTAKEATKDEIGKVVNQMVMGPKLETLELALVTPGGGDVFLNHLIQKMEAEYRDVLKLAANMFEMKVKTEPADEPKVSEKFVATLNNVPKRELKGPNKVEIRHLVHRYLWELAPQSAAGEPADPQCVPRESELFWPEEYVPAPKPAAAKKAAAEKKLQWKKRLLKAGDYKLRVTALALHDVPLAQSKVMDAKILPARLLGTLETTGEWDAQKQPITLFLGRHSREEKVTRLDKANEFDKPICAFSESVIPSKVPEDKGLQAPPPKFPPHPLWSFAGVEVTDPMRIIGVDDPRTIEPDPKSKRVEVVHEARAKFKLKKPLRIDFDRKVAVAVKVYDATEKREVKGAEIILRKGIAMISGSSPFEVDLRPGDIIQAEARHDAKEFTVRGKSEVMVYDPEKDKAGITLKVKLPFFAAGSLVISGQFVPEGANTEETKVAGGVFRSTRNLFEGERRVAEGGEFKFTNARPLRLSERVVIDAVLHRKDGRLLRPVGRIHRKVGAMPRVWPGKVTVRPFDVRVDNIRIAVRDWAGATIPEKGTRVTLGVAKTNTAFRSGEEYVASWLFQAFNETVPIEASFAMPQGPPVKATAHLSINDVGKTLLDLLRPKPPKDPIEIALEVYAPGSLRVKGRIEAAPTPGAMPPGKAELWFALGHPDIVRGEMLKVGAAFLGRFDEPVRRGALLELTAKAAAGDAVYRATAKARAPRRAEPGKPVVADFGVVTLKPKVLLVKLPVVVGQKLRRAKGTLAAAGLRAAPQAGKPASSRAKEGVVYRQEPLPSRDKPLMRPRNSLVKVWAYGKAPDDTLLSRVPKVRIESVTLIRSTLLRPFKPKARVRVVVERMRKGNPVNITLNWHDFPKPRLIDQVSPGYKVGAIDGDYAEQRFDFEGEHTGYVKEYFATNERYFGDYYVTATATLPIDPKIHTRESRKTPGMFSGGWKLDPKKGRGIWVLRPPRDTGYNKKLFRSAVLSSTTVKYVPDVKPPGILKIQFDGGQVRGGAYVKGASMSAEYFRLGRAQFRRNGEMDVGQVTVADSSGRAKIEWFCKVSVRVGAGGTIPGQALRCTRPPSPTRYDVKATIDGVPRKLGNPVLRISGKLDFGFERRTDRKLPTAAGRLSIEGLYKGRRVRLDGNWHLGALTQIDPLKALGTAQGPKWPSVHFVTGEHLDAALSRRESYCRFMVRSGLKKGDQSGYKDRCGGARATR